MQFWAVRSQSWGPLCQSLLERSLSVPQTVLSACSPTPCWSWTKVCYNLSGTERLPKQCPSNLALISSQAYSFSCALKDWFQKALIKIQIFTGRANILSSAVIATPALPFHKLLVRKGIAEMKLVSVHSNIYCQPTTAKLTARNLKINKTGSPPSGSFLSDGGDEHVHSHFYTVLHDEL